MKKRILSLLLFVALIVSTLSLSSCGSKQSKNPTRPDDIPETDTSEYDLDSDVYRTIAETENTKFEFNDLTTDIRLTNKKTGFVWSTEYNSYDDILEENTVTRGEVFTLNYYTNTGAILSMSSAGDSVEKGQFRVLDIDNGIGVQYGLGDINFVIDFPLAMSPERKDQFYNQMTPEQQEIFDNAYELINFNDDVYKDPDQTSEEDLKQKQESYPLAVNQDNGWYYMTAGINQRNVDELHDLWRVQITTYTDADMNKDNDGVKVADLDRAEFNVQINYTLVGDDLKVSIPEDKIYYATNYTIESIQLHPNLLDFDNSYSGYYLLPDGSGSILNFNNGKDELRNDPIYIQMYGVDEARGIEEKTAYYNEAILPVYGCTIRSKAAKPVAAETEAISELANEKNTASYNGLFATIESGDAFAGIEAHSGSPVGDIPTHNRAFTEFRINECMKMKSFSSNAGDSDERYSKYQFQRYLGKLSVVYHMLSGDDATYTGMANYYRKQLFGDEKAEKKDYYSAVETVGEINGNGLFMGISYNKKIALTTFEQTKEIAEDLQKNGFTNLNVKLSGWCNGGYEHGYLNKIKVSSNLGGKEEFESLIDTMANDKIGLFPDVDYQYVYANEKSVKRSDNSSGLNGSRNILERMYNIFFQETVWQPRYALTVSAMEKNLNDFMSSYADYNIKNISMRSIGDKITANYREDDFCERQETMENIVKQVSGVKDKEYNIMGTNGDAPFLKYLDYLNETPIVSAGYDKSDYSVPFVPMVLSGHVQYTADAINLSNNDRLDLLHMVEGGAGAYYILSGTQYADISETGMEELYATNYEDVKDIVISSFDYLKSALNDVYGLEITKHTILADDVNMVTYENGVSIVINYTDSDYSANGITCKAKDYAVVKGA